VPGIAIAVVVALIGVALAMGGDDDDDQPTAAGEIFLEPIAEVGRDPFTESVAAPPPTPPTIPPNAPVTIQPAGPQGPAITAPALPGGTGTTLPTGGPTSGPSDGGTATIPVIRGNTPGLYGGTRDQSSCNQQQMIDFLNANPSKARAWAEAQGITPGEIGSYISGLTPVLLRSDTRVTNHGFAGGRATAKQSVLQAGTAVLVDDRGVPRVRCACGNPLVEAEATSSSPDFTGDGWDGFASTRLVAIRGGNTVNNFTVVNVQSGDTYETEVGSGAPAEEGEPTTSDSGDVVLAQDGLGVVPFGTPEEEAVAALTEELGPPDRDTQEECVSGSESTTRVLNWGRLWVEVGPQAGLYHWIFFVADNAALDLTEFNDSDIEGPPFPDSELRTPEGLGQEATIAEFDAAYGTQGEGEQRGFTVHAVTDRFQAFSLSPEGVLIEFAAASAQLDENGDSRECSLFLD